MSSFESKSLESNLEIFPDLLTEAESDVTNALAVQRDIENKAENIKNLLRSSPDSYHLLKQIEEIEKESRGLMGRFTDAIGWIIRLAVISGVLMVNGDNKPSSHFERFEERIKQAQIEMSESGITSEQQEAYIPQISEFIYRNVRPWSYNPWQTLSEIPQNIRKGRQPADSVSEDAWRMYLGLPQKNQSFEVSPYKPTKTKRNEDILYYSIVGDVTHFMNVYESSSASEMIKNLVFFTRNEPIFSDDNGPLGKFSWSSGKDQKGSYLAYYDKWDLGYTFEGENGIIGKPFDVYGRIYYNEKTYEPIY